MNESSLSPAAANSEPPAPALCPACHQPVKPEFYFCPNCGKNLQEPPLSVSVGAQTGLYFMSIITPPMCFLTIGAWHGMQYLKSADLRAKQIGIIAVVLMVVSTVVTVWLVYAFTVQLMSLVSSLSGGLLGGSGSGL